MPVAFMRNTLLLIIVLLQAQNAIAQQGAALSPSVVLVLRLVSTTHVRPTTGIVISDAGLVLVPADFVSTDSGNVEDEILVLDGGTDILSNGRPAIVVNRSVSGGLAILSVEGLKRPGFKLSEDVFGPQRELHLEAFPPAEYIAKGADPLWIPVSPETPLPYVSGPIIDECGYLAGLSLAHGSQSLDAGTVPETIPALELKHTLAALQLDLPGASCVMELQKAEPLADTDDDVNEPEVIPEAEEQAPAGEAVTTGMQQPINAESSTDTARVDVAIQSNAPLIKTNAPASLWRSVPWWLPLLALIVLAVSAWKAFFFYRLHKKHGAEIATDNSNIQPASDEPDTAMLDGSLDSPGSDTVSAKPRSAPINEIEIPDVNTLPEGYNGILVLEGLFDSDTIVKKFCLVNTQQAGVVIGRGEVDISIEHPAISRSHACLELNAGVMTLSDSGSNNGTYINGIPCLSGEIMFIECEDDIFLGGLQVRVSLMKKEMGIS